MFTEEDEFNEHLCARTKRLREAMDWSAEQMAIRLGIPPDRYRKYEKRSPMPQYLIPRFAGLVGRSISFILTGADEVATRSPIEQRKRA